MNARCERPGARCWACSYSGLGTRAWLAEEAYETAVELIESWPGTFTRTELARSLWDQMRAVSDPSRRQRWRYGASTAHTYANHAVSDLSRHGLIRCVRRSGRRCLEWSRI